MAVYFTLRLSGILEVSASANLTMALCMYMVVVCWSSLVCSTTALTISGWQGHRTLYNAPKAIEVPLPMLVIPDTASSLSRY
jgi:hypothetical protein